MQGPHVPHNPTLRVVLLAVGLASSASPSWAQSRDCVTSNVTQAFTLPDGSSHAAGRLTICMLRAFTPVIGLHRVWADDDGASLVMSRLAPAEAIADSGPVLLFRSAPGRPLDLVGYVMSSGRRSWSYTLRRPAPTGLAGPKTFGAVQSPEEPIRTGRRGTGPDR